MKRKRKQEVKLPQFVVDEKKLYKDLKQLAELYEAEQSAKTDDACEYFGNILWRRTRETFGSMKWLMWALQVVEADRTLCSIPKCKTCKEMKERRGAGS